MPANSNRSTRRTGWPQDPTVHRIGSAPVQCRIVFARCRGLSKRCRAVLTRCRGVEGRCRHLWHRIGAACRERRPRKWFGTETNTPKEFRHRRCDNTIPPGRARRPWCKVSARRCRTPNARCEGRLRRCGARGCGCGVDSAQRRVASAPCGMTNRPMQDRDLFDAGSIDGRCRVSRRRMQDGRSVRCRIVRPSMSSGHRLRSWIRGFCALFDHSNDLTGPSEFDTLRTDSAHALARRSG